MLAAATKTRSGEVRTLAWVAAVFALRPLRWMKSATSPMVMWGLIYLVIFFCSIVWCYEYYEESLISFVLEHQLHSLSVPT